MKEWTREEVERLVPEISEPWKHDVWKLLLQTRLDLEMAKKHIDEHYTGAATGYIKELESEVSRLRGALERIAVWDVDHVVHARKIAHEALKATK